MRRFTLFILFDISNVILICHFEIFFSDFLCIFNTVARQEHITNARTLWSHETLNILVVIRSNFVIKHFDRIFKLIRRYRSVRECALFIFKRLTQLHFEWSFNGRQHEGCTNLILTNTVSQHCTVLRNRITIHPQNQLKLFRIVLARRLERRRIYDHLINDTFRCVQVEFIRLSLCNFLVNQLFYRRLLKKLVIEQTFIVLIAKLTTQLIFLLSNLLLNFDAANLIVANRRYGFFATAKIDNTFNTPKCENNNNKTYDDFGDDALRIITHGL